MNPPKNALDDLKSRAREVRPNLTRVVANPAMGREGLTALWFGEPDIPTPQFICQAAVDSMAAGETFYTPGLGTDYLRAALSEYLSALHQTRVNADRIAVTVSGGNALNLAFQCLLEQGDIVATHLPAFPNLLSIPSLQGADIRTSRLILSKDGWQANMDELISLASAAKVILINSPSNPTGWVMERSEQLELLEACRKTGTWIISDEVYSRIYFDGRAAPSLLEVAEPEDRVLVVNSFSKAWAMTGWRLGWLVVPPSLLETLERIMEFSISSAPGFAQRAGVQALKCGESFVDQLVSRYEGNLHKVSEEFQSIERIRFQAPKSTFYAYFQIDGVRDNVAFAQQMIDEANLGLAPGRTFDPDAVDWFRLCFAASDDRLQAALNKLKRFLN